jgi:hypothetical protein
LTPQLTLRVTFEQVSIAITYRPVRFRANSLLNFEAEMRSHFPEKCRTRFSNKIDAGYCLVIFGTGLKKRVPINIRGPHSVNSNAAFTGVLNTVDDGATVRLEWI